MSQFVLNSPLPLQVSATPVTMSVQGELRSIDAIVTPQEETRIEPEILPVKVRIVHYLFSVLMFLNIRDGS